MKKYIASGLVVFGLLAFFVPFISNAAQDVDPNPSTSSCISLSNNMRYQSRDVDTKGEVSKLQDFLQAQGYLNSEPTGYFGLMTKQAVISFQTANGTGSDGYVGPITRAKIKSISCGDVTVVNPVPPGGQYKYGCSSNEGYSSMTGEKCSGGVAFPDGCSSNSGYSTTTGQPCGGSSPALFIYSLSQTSGKAGDFVNVYGSGFTSDSEVDFGIKDQIIGTLNGKNVSSVTSKQLTFKLDSTLVSNLNPGVYRLFVYNNTGKSNSVDFIILNTDGSYPAGCSSSYGYSTTTGKSCGGEIVQPYSDINITIGALGTLPKAKLGSSYDTPLKISSNLPKSSKYGINSYDVSVGSTGRMPNGLYFSASDEGHLIAGTPTEAGTFSFAITASTKTISQYLDTSVRLVSITKFFTLTVDGTPTLLSVNGSCGGAVYVYSPQVPTNNFCSAGEVSTRSSHDNGTTSWSCAGVNGGSTASCSTIYSGSGGTGGGAAVVNGQCGGAINVQAPQVPTNNLCYAGTASSTSTHADGTAGWSCNGSGGGSTATCSTIYAGPGGVSVTGSCGGAVYVYSPQVPTNNFCSAGNASSVTTHDNGTASWSCNGSGGGGTASCSTIYSGHL